RRSRHGTVRVWETELRQPPIAPETREILSRGRQMRVDVKGALEVGLGLVEHAKTIVLTAHGDVRVCRRVEFECRERGTEAGVRRLECRRIARLRSRRPGDAGIDAG